MKRLVLFVTIIMCLALTSCQSVITEKIKVSGIVTEMQYEESSSTLVPYFDSLTNMTSLRTETIDEKYLVTITYEDISKTFDKKTLYQTVKKGDIVQVILCEHYDEDGNLIGRTLELAE